MPRPTSSFMQLQQVWLVHKAQGRQHPCAQQAFFGLHVCSPTISALLCHPAQRPQEHASSVMNLSCLFHSGMCACAHARFHTHPFPSPTAPFPSPSLCSLLHLPARSQSCCAKTDYLMPCRFWGRQQPLQGSIYCTLDGALYLHSCCTHCWTSFLAVAWPAECCN